MYPSNKYKLFGLLQNGSRRETALFPPGSMGLDVICPVLSPFLLYGSFSLVIYVFLIVNEVVELWFTWTTGRQTLFFSVSSDCWIFRDVAVCIVAQCYCGSIDWKDVSKQVSQIMHNPVFSFNATCVHCDQLFCTRLIIWYVFCNGKWWFW